MGELGGFLKIERVGVPYRDPRASARTTTRSSSSAGPTRSCAAQGARCMDCGVPFCHNGCPLGNLIPDWNDLVYRDRWHDAIRQLHATNNFPEFTGRLCPAPCEAACVLEIREGDAVTIKQIENSIIDRAWEEGWVVAAAAARARRGRSVAVVGAGPGRAWPPRSSCAAPATRVVAVRARRGRRRPGPLRRAGLQDREARRRAARRPARRRGRRAALRRRRRRRRHRRRAARASSTRSCWRSARACRATCRSTGRELDGIHFAMEYLYVPQPLGRDADRRADRRARRRRPDHRRGQARRRHRRRRHRRRLRRQLDPRGRASVVQLELLPEPPAAPPRRPHAVAAVAAEVPPLLRDGGGAGRRARASRTSRS